MQRRRTVQHDRVLTDHFFKNVPNNGLLQFNQLLRSLDGSGQTHQLQLVENEGLEQLERHQLRQTALMQFELRTNHDDRTARVVDALAEQVLTETTAFTFDHFSQRLQRTLVSARHGLATTTIIEQRINGFLQHALFVTRNNFWRTQLHQTTQTVVAVDHATIQVVQIGGRETAAVERHQRPQFGRQHRQHFHDHPLRLDARALECLKHLQALGVFLDLRFRLRFAQIGTQLLRFAINVDRA